MGLILENTCWLFLLPSSSAAEQRHIFDIAFGVRVLLNKKIPLENIVLLIDGCTNSLLVATFALMGISVPEKIFPTTHYHQLLKDNVYENVVVFVTGHGSIEGIDSVEPIKPYAFYQALKTAPNLKKSVVYFGQCEDGVYNDISLKTNSEGLNNSRIVAIGASGFHNSLSSPSIIPNGMWSANIFLARLFSWIQDPIDIDGDGKFSVIDSYKYASIWTYADCKRIEHDYEIKDAKAKFALSVLKEEIEEKRKHGTLTADQELQKKALETTISNLSFDQVPWILNADAGMDIFY